MCRVVRPPPRHCSTACCNSRRRSSVSACSPAETRTMTEPLTDLGDKIASACKGRVLRSETVRGELIVWIERTALRDTVLSLRDDPQLLFKILIDVTAVDYPGRPERFEVVYQLLSVRLNRRVRVKVAADEATPVPSVTSIFSSAGWYEREVWDL